MNFITPEILCSNLKIKEYADTTLILDVRDVIDFPGGHIIGAINIPYSEINIIKFINLIKTTYSNIKRIILHCMYSSIRGRGTYNRLYTYFKINMINIELFLIKDGFFNFINYIIKKDTDTIQKFIENYDKDIWILHNKKYYHKTEIITTNQ